MSTQSGSTTAEGYALNRDPAFLNEMTRRAQIVLGGLGYITQHLRSGTRLLDCGCGNGELTLQLAKSAATAETIGLDLDEQAIEQARVLAAEQHTTNVRFEAGDVYRLPYPDASFDAVVAVFLLFHLSDPLAALKEMRRVLRPGGIAGLHDGEQSMWVFVPENPLLNERNDIVSRIQELNGGMPIYARHQRSLLLEAGFARAEQAASAATAIEQGWIDQARADEVVAAIHEWSTRPDAMSFQVTFQAVGFVE